MVGCRTAEGFGMGIHKVGVVAVENKETEIVLTEREKKLLELIRSTGNGEISLTIEDAQLVNVKEIIKKIKL